MVSYCFYVALYNVNYNHVLYSIKMMINAVHVKRQPSGDSVTDMVPVTMDGLRLFVHFE